MSRLDLGDMYLRNPYFKWVGLFLLFFLFLYDKDMAMIYIVLLLVDYFWFTSDVTGISFPLQRRGDKLADSFLLALVGYAAFLLLNTLVKTYFLGGTFSLFDGVTAMATLPILAGSAAMTWIGWALVIPIIETSFFHGRLLEGFAEGAKRMLGITIPLNKLSMALVVVFIAISSIFTIFHSKVTLAPMVTIFIFSMVSCYLVIREKKLLAAVLLHIIANTCALAVKFGVI